ncbi:MAG: TraB/GumN family protein [Erysipelotrichaceae bacterium]|nr:TraB/GumN family protein [Erysipelotrichaceae bacterium]MDY5252062.1 TraB/GumN family protein [Erysipelotrichaceae bacterium]
MQANLQKITINDKEIYLLGTAHVSKISAQETNEIINQLEPDSVCIELDSKRYESLNNPKKWQETNITTVIKKKQTGLLLANLILSSYQKRIAKKMDSTSGLEMLEAIKLCKEKDINLELVDRDIQTTFTRIYRKHNFWQKMKLIFTLIYSIFEDEEISQEDIENLKQQDILSAALKEVEKEFPLVAEVLIDERNKILAHNIKNAPGKKIVAIVGAAHIPGMLEYIYEDYSIDEIMEVPPKTLGAKIKGWILPLIIMLVILMTFSIDSSQGIDQIQKWFFINGTLSAIGTLLAFGHPLAIITAFFAAPITSLNPLLAAGWFAGLVEAYFRKPKVKDLQDINEATNSLKAMYQNRFTHILLVVIFANVFSSLGTLVASLDIFRSFIALF